MSLWTGPQPIPWPREEDPLTASWWDGLNPDEQVRWGPLLANLDKRGRAHFHHLRRSMRDAFRCPEGTPEREGEEAAAAERLYTRTAEGVAKLERAGRVA